jgi:hypothetical protein
MKSKHIHDHSSQDYDKPETEEASPKGP